MENVTEVLRELRETNNALLSTKQNETMKILTLFTFLALPFTIIASLFQMNTNSTPLVNSNIAWPIIVGTEIFITLILFTIAKKKKWF